MLTGCALGPNRGADAGAEIVVQGEVAGVRVVDCRIERGPGIVGIAIAAEAGDVDLAGTTVAPATGDAIVRLAAQAWSPER
ncbi:MAG: hypothetical protein H0W72_03355 [Planctomycetes bacterium]|nr:hypothetical protein [Planctomycetota bacterium]